MIHDEIYFGEKEEKFIFIMDKYGEEIKRTIFLYVKNWDAANDITQEVFITVFNKLDTLENESPNKRSSMRSIIQKNKFLRFQKLKNLLLLP